MTGRTLAVIAARFQIDQPHEGHVELIDSVLSGHDAHDVVIILGQHRSYETTKNPLTFKIREGMIREIYPDINICSLDDCYNKPLWSRNLDILLTKKFPECNFIFYGSRESFLSTYVSDPSFPKTTHYIDDIESLSGTDRRVQIADLPVEELNSPEFRKAVIWLMMNKPTITYNTVDIAICNHKTRQVLLCEKVGSNGKLCFIGGFVDPTDETFVSAALRETEEETGLSSLLDVKNIGDTLIDDKRYRGTPDRVRTTFFCATYVGGEPVASDDIEEIHWVDYDRIKKVIQDEHQPLADMFLLSTYRIEHIMNAG